MGSKYKVPLILTAIILSSNKPHPGKSPHVPPACKINSKFFPCLILTGFVDPYLAFINV